MYNNYGADITSEFTLVSGHGYPTLDFGNACSTTLSPYINICAYNGAYESFKVLYGSSILPPVTMIAANLLTFA